MSGGRAFGAIFAGFDFVIACVPKLRWHVIGFECICIALLSQGRNAGRLLHMRAAATSRGPVV